MVVLKGAALLLLLLLLLVQESSALVQPRRLALGKMSCEVASSSSKVVRRRVQCRSAAAVTIEEEDEGGFPRLRAAMSPRLGPLDRKIAGVAVPSILGLMVFPLVGAVDTMFVGRMGDALALAGAGAANSAFSCVFFSLAALPTLTAPLVAKAHARGDDKQVQRSVADALIMSGLLGVVGSFLIFKYPERLLTAVALDPSAAALKPAAAYLKTRALGFAPALISTTCFAVYRGLLDTRTPLYVSCAYNLLNALLDPLLIFGCGMGVVGAALATAIAELFGAVLYVILLTKKGVLKTRLLAAGTDVRALLRLLRAGASMQARQLLLNLAFASASKTAQDMDPTGVQAAAYAISQQFWLVCGVSLFALQSAAATLVPSALFNNEEQTVKNARKLADRLIAVGFYMGLGLCFVQLASLPALRLFSPLPAVYQAAILPTVLSALMQPLNGVAFAGEGVMLGLGALRALATQTAVGGASMFAALRFAKKKQTGLKGVIAAIALFNVLQLAAALFHHLKLSPLSARSRRTTKKDDDSDAPQ